MVLDHLFAGTPVYPRCQLVCTSRSPMPPRSAETGQTVVPDKTAHLCQGVKSAFDFFRCARCTRLRYTDADQLDGLRKKIATKIIVKPVKGEWGTKGASTRLTEPLTLQEQLLATQHRWRFATNFEKDTRPFRAKAICQMAFDFPHSEGRARTEQLFVETQPTIAVHECSDSALA